MSWKGDLACDQMLSDAVVHALVMAAEYDDVFEHRHGVGHRLVEGLAVGRGEDHFVVVTLRFQVAYSAVNRLNLHHHSGFAAEGVIVDLAVAVGGVVAEVMDVDFHETLVLRAFEDGAVEG